MGILRVERANPDLIISHWCRLIENAKASPVAFYQRLEQVILDRKIPQLESGAIQWPEGGPFSAKRKYLRLLRERLVIDVCAAPFGTGFFVSWRLGELRLHLNFLGLFILIVALLSVAASTINQYRYEFFYNPRLLYSVVLVPLFAFIALLTIMRGAVGAGLCNLDALLLQTPVIAGFYERFLRPVTYYRIDLAMMYEQAVHAAVMQVIDEMTEAQHLPRLTEAERKPILRDFYKR